MWSVVIFLRCIVLNRSTWYLIFSVDCLPLTSACCSTNRQVGTRKSAGGCKRLITSAAMRVFPEPEEQAGGRMGRGYRWSLLTRGTRGKIITLIFSNAEAYLYSKTNTTPQRSCCTLSPDIRGGVLKNGVHFCFPEERVKPDSTRSFSSPQPFTPDDCNFFMACNTR